MTSFRSLAASFPVFTEEDWRRAAAATRRGGIRGEPTTLAFPRRVAAQTIDGRPPGQPWQVVQRIDAGDAIRLIGDEIAGGATGIELVFSGSLHPAGRGLPQGAAVQIAEGLAATLPEGFHLRLDDGGSHAVADVFIDLASTRKTDLTLTFDPVASEAVGGAPADGMGARLTALTKPLDAGAIVTCDGRLWHAGGATDEQELAVVLASFVENFRLLESPGRIAVALAADADQFRTIAKFRAIRLLLARIGEITGLLELPRIHGETAWRTMSARDPEMNILRATSAAFAAAAGGADSITVLPFDGAEGSNDAHARRLARNTQTILAEEANLFRVADPAAGSGAIEAMTERLAEGAWAQFQAIEKQGGIVAAISGGALLREIAKAREERRNRVARRDITMIGVNAYTGTGDAPAARATQTADTSRLVFKRLSEPFEAGAA